MRVESRRPKVLSDGSTGWLHPIGEAPAPRPVREDRPAPVLDVKKTLRFWRGGPAKSVEKLATNLGLTPASLELLECGPAPYKDTWYFPMKDGKNGYVGIRLRRENGDKWAEKGSHQGLFIPLGEPDKLTLIAEGPTDTAAGLMLGYFTIGRPSCCGGIEHLKTAVKHFGIRRAVIVSDLDGPGLRGAKALAEHLPIPTAILVLPAKDFRAAVTLGMDRGMCDAMITELVWRQP